MTTTDRQSAAASIVVLVSSVLVTAAVLYGAMLLAWHVHPAFYILAGMVAVSGTITAVALAGTLAAGMKKPGNAEKAGHP